MVIPANSGAVQIPVANTFQPGATEISKQEQEPKEEQTQPALASAAESQSSEQQTPQSRDVQEENNSIFGENDSSEATAERGSLLNIEI